MYDIKTEPPDKESAELQQAINALFQGMTVSLEQARKALEALEKAIVFGAITEPPKQAATAEQRKKAKAASRRNLKRMLNGGRLKPWE